MPLSSSGPRSSRAAGSMQPTKAVFVQNARIARALRMFTSLGASVMSSVNVPRPHALWAGFAVGVLAVGGLLWIALATPPPITLNLALVICGGGAGWALGILVSPYSGEESTFSEYGKAISTFLSGFVLAKLSQFISYALDNKLLTFDTTFLTRALLFTAPFCIFVLFNLCCAEVLTGGLAHPVKHGVPRFHSTMRLPLRDVRRVAPQTPHHDL